MPDFSPDTLKAAIVAALNDGTLKPDPGPSAPPPESRSKTPMRIAEGVMGAGQLADALTTIAALKRPNTSEGNSGIYGSNPSAARVLATKAAVMVPTGILLDKAYEHHPKTAEILALALGGLGMGLAAHNTGMGR